jgi:hypothetical protein
LRCDHSSSLSQINKQLRSLEKAEAKERERGGKLLSMSDRIMASRIELAAYVDKKSLVLKNSIREQNEHRESAMKHLEGF